VPRNREAFQNASNTVDSSPFLSKGGFGEGAIYVNVWDKKKPKPNGQCPEHSSGLLQCVIDKIRLGLHSCV